MKNSLIVLATFLSLGYTSIAQEEENLFKKHELKIDAVELIAVANAEFTYEYLFSKYSGAGVAITFDLEGQDDFDDMVRYAITPFYRQYFFNRQEKLAQGLFAEVHLNIGGFKDTSYNSSVDDYDVYTASALGAGFGIGYKWASENGFVIEALVGVGRNLSFFSEPSRPNEDSYYYTDFDFYFRGGIQIGYRF
ncbi:MAG: DUF3575 domain-containing protein [Leeuwenhoekiella sp.]